LGYDPHYDTGTISAAPMAESGAVTAKVFLDENNNDIHDENERVLEGVGFRLC